MGPEAETHKEGCPQVPEKGSPGWSQHVTAKPKWANNWAEDRLKGWRSLDKKAVHTQVESTGEYGHFQVTVDSKVHYISGKSEGRVKLSPKDANVWFNTG